MRTIWSTLLLPSLFVGGEAANAADPNSWRSKVKVVRNGYYPLDVVDKLEESVMPKVEAWMAKKAAEGKNNNCTLENASVRREWSDMSVREREEYTAAVTCLMRLPAQAPKKKYPGALSRYDDFVAYHITHAQMLHDTIHLFAAHKQFLYVYEKALRTECGYKGHHPYMNYDRYSNDPINSPLFNGNASSLGGNGAPDPSYKGVPQSGRTPNIIKSGGGGGCVTSGPFKDMVVSLGPRMAKVNSIPKNPQADGLGSNPRCLRRDINRNAAMGATADRAYNLITSSKDINAFYHGLLGQPPPKNDPYPWGIHTAGHYIYGVDPGGDPATSPGDPAFYFHHGALDRLWWIWQMQDPENRINAVPSLKAPASSVPTAGHSHKKRGEEGHSLDRRAEDPKDAYIDLEWLAPRIPLLEANDQLGGNGGAFCYVYV